MDAPLFDDRQDAGRQLAKALRGRVGAGAVVLGLPRGGVPVAAEVARGLGLPLDVMVARKLGAPGHAEFAIGAVAPGVVVLDEASVEALHVTQAEIDERVALENREMERRFEVYRGRPGMPDVRGKEVVLVDDGLATGATARAAVRALRRAGPRRVVLAVPVAAPQAVDALGREADEVVAVATPRDFQAVGLWYRDFSQTSDDEVLDALHATGTAHERHLRIPVDGHEVLGDLVVPPNAKGLVVFAHGSGSGRFSPRNRAVARALNEAGLATLLADLLTPREEAEDAVTREHRFDIPLLAERVTRLVDFVRADADLGSLPVGLFGASTGAAAALVAASRRPDDVVAVVSRGGRPDLADDALERVRAPTLLVVGGRDDDVIGLNEAAHARLACRKDLVLVAGATHLFEEPGTLEEVASLAAEWFLRRAAEARGAHPVRR